MRENVTSSTWALSWEDPTWISWQDRIPGTEVLGRASIPSVPTLLGKIQLRWAGYVTTMACVRPPKIVFFVKLPNKHSTKTSCVPKTATATLWKHCFRLTSNTWNMRNDPSLRTGEDPMLCWRGNAAPASQGFASCLTCPACCSLPGLDWSPQLSTKTHKFGTCHWKEVGRMCNVNIPITVLNLATDFKHRPCKTISMACSPSVLFWTWKLFWIQLSSPPVPRAKVLVTVSWRDTAITHVIPSIHTSGSQLSPWTHTT